MTQPNVDVEQWFVVKSFGRGLQRRGFAAAIFVFGFISGMTPAARAVLDANSQSNTNAPADGSPWGNVGHVNGASGVYLGSGWMMTASHVGAGNVTFDVGSFTWSGVSDRLTNSDGTATDIVLFQLTTTPSLPSLTLASSSPSALSAVDMIGNGHIAGSGEQSIGAYTGFTWSSGAYKSWGNNRVAAGGTSVINAGFGNITVFSTDFDQFAQTSDEAQATAGDSGGAVFQQIGSDWGLVGMLDAIGTLSGQNANTSVYGDATYSADLFTYREQMLAIIPEPSAIGMMLAGLGGVWVFRRRRGNV